MRSTKLPLSKLAFRSVLMAEAPQLKSHLSTSPPTSSSHPSLVIPTRFFPISSAELSLPAVLKCGQTFRWIQSRFQLQSDHPNPRFENSSLTVNSHKHNPELDLGLTNIEEWSIGWDDRTVVLRQDDAGIYYSALYPPSAIQAYELDMEHNTTYDRLKKYFVLEVSLVELYRDWSKRDPIFASKVAGGTWDGLRVCRQDAWETMVAFICSANNNIPRNTLMLNRLCATFGNSMPTAARGLTLSPSDRMRIKPSDAGSHPAMYSFPSPSRLSQADVPEQLKQLGFGYRAKYVWKTSVKLCEIARRAQQEGRWPTPSCVSDLEETEQKRLPIDYLDFLSRQTYSIAHSALVNDFPGIGPKVGDCICLFGLGFVHIVPVDVHVYQIASRDYQIETSSPRKKTASSPNSPSKPFGTLSSLYKHQNDDLKPLKKGPVSKLEYGEIQSRLHELWGPWAGWAQQILFLADLKHGNLVASPIKIKRKRSE